MQKMAFLTLIGCVVLLNGCSRRFSEPHEVVVDQSYIHRYGVPVEGDSWQSQGSSGKVITTLKNGVIVTSTHAHGMLEGDTTYTYPHSELIEKTETYESNVLVKETHYYRNGTPSHQITYSPPATQTILAWYDSGAPESTEVLENGLLVKGEYFDLTHRPDSKVDNLNGLRTRRDAFGHLLGVDTISNGSLVLTKTFHPNGAVKEEIPYTNGQINGSLKTYLPDGVPVSIETWTNGDKTGMTRLFENGELVAEVPYVRGVKNGIEKRYRNGKVVVQENSWVEDIRHGPSASYIGEVTTTDYYYQGNPVSKPVYDKMANGVIPHR